MNPVLSLGAPGIYREPDSPLRTLTGIRMDVCGFAGVAPRGPARERVEGVERRSVPRAVESWSEYLRLFGGFEGPGLLPYAVASFFEQGGRRAYVVRIVHDYGGAADGDGVAWGAVPGLHPMGQRGTPIRARVDGHPGNGIRVSLQWRTVALPVHPLPSADRLATRAELALAVAAPAAPSEVEPGSLLRLGFANGSRALAFVEAVRRETVRPGDGGPAQIRDLVVLRAPLGADPVTAERVAAELRLEPPDGGPAEVHASLGLSPGLGLRARHERWLGDVLRAESALVAPDPRWLTGDLEPENVSLAPPPPSDPLRGGVGREPARGVIAGVRPVDDGLWLAARSEGSWGNRLRAELRIRGDVLQLRAAGLREVSVARDVLLPAGTVLRLTLPDGTARVRRVIDTLEEWEEGSAGRVRRSVLDASLSMAPVQAEVLEAELRVTEAPADGDASTRAELHQRLGLDPAHPRWLARVLAEESDLLRADPAWEHLPLDLSGVGTDTAAAAVFAGGEDRYGDITPEDVVPEPDAGGGAAADGVGAMARLSDLSLLVVPDLYSPEPLAPLEVVVGARSHAGPDFALCVSPEVLEQEPQSDRLVGLRLDPRERSGRERICALQQRLVELAARHRRFVALLDVPPGLSHAQLLEWRSRFASDFAAGYHPWLSAARLDDARTGPVTVNPSAVAAGIIARQEARFGVQHGPANALANGAVAVAERVSPGQHDQLHPLGINVFLRERDGVRLTAARTLSRAPEYRQLSVRRLVTLIVRTLEQEMQWTVFEPSSRVLRTQIVQQVTMLLRSLFRAGAFAGASEEESFFVRCDDALNPRPSLDAGRLVVEVGVAPAEPLEFIVLRLARGGEGGLRVEG